MLSFLKKKRSTVDRHTHAVRPYLTGVLLALVKCDCQPVVSNSALMLLTP